MNVGAYVYSYGPLLFKFITQNELRDIPSGYD